MKKRGTAVDVSILDMKQDIAPENLFLDWQNPRVADQELGLKDQDKIILYLWKEKDVAELVDSISSSGYWRQELLFATQEDGKCVVVEGNRRLAAVQLLRSPERCARLGIKGVPHPLKTSIAESIKTLPVVICTRQQLWKYMSFKHLNGPQEWDSIAKAEYVARVHDEFGVDLDTIADTIGDRHETVKRLLRGLRVLKQAEHDGVFNPGNRWPSRRFPYSHLWTALGYASVKRFLGLGPDAIVKRNPVPRSKLSELGLFCTWLYGDKDKNIRPLVVTQNPDLGRLAEVMSTENGLAALRRGLSLDTCIRQSRGDIVMLRESLVSAEASLREASAYVATGYAGENDMEQVAEKVVQLSTDILERMKQRRKKEDKS